LFEGPFLDDIPDILLELNEDYTGGSAFAGDLVTPVPLSDLSEYSASHHPDGLFVVRGAGVRAGAWIEGAEIIDLPPTLMHLMGLPAASWMDGKVITGIFEPSAIRPVTYADYDLAEVDRSVRLSSDEEEAIRAQLAGLGYLRE
jgi:hypothetical protein